MGLLAKATAMREQWEKEATLQNTIETPKTTVKKNTHPKLRKLVAALFAVGLTIHANTPKNAIQLNASNKQLNTMTKIELEAVHPTQEQTLNAKIDQIFNHDYTYSVVSDAERDNLARLVYGEAGPSIIDWIEVIHTVLNRYASPLFKGSINDIITAKNQYIGFNTNNPVIAKIREVVDFVVNDWEAHDRQEIDDCNHFYFVTDIRGVCNKYKISPKGSHGSWTATKDEYEHYCPTAERQAAGYQLMKKYQAARLQTESKIIQ